MHTWILPAIAGLIVYGSLFPFNFTVPLAHGDAWTTLFTRWSWWSSRMDALGNLLLFVPFGLAGMLCAAKGTNVVARVLFLSAVGFVLALAVQLAQIYVPQRTPSLSDVFWNLVGLLGGVFVATNLRLALPRFKSGTVLPLLVIALWLIAQLLPFVPSLDVQTVKGNLKGLLAPALAYDQLLFHAAGMLMVGRALTAIVDKTRALLWLIVLAGVVVLGKVFVVTLNLNVSTLAGLAIGFTGWWVMTSWREPQRGTMVLLILLLAYVIDALMPFEFRSDGEFFGWLPFSGLLRGSMLANLQGLAANLFLYAGILWIIHSMGGRLIPSGVGLAVMVLMFEMVQIFLVGRTPEITEPLLVLLLAQLMRAVADGAPAREASTRTPREPPPRAVPQRVVPQRSAPQHAVPQRRQTPAVEAPVLTAHTAPLAAFNPALWGGQILVICVLMAFVFYGVLRLPRLPYNVVELFLWNGAFPFLVMFALALLWIGAGARLVGHFVSVSRAPWLRLPLLAFGAAVVNLLLLYASVTDESIGDISGSNNLHWFVVNKDIWGAWARELFAYLPAGLVAFFERPVRFAALYAPLVTFLALMFVVAQQMSGRVSPLRGKGLLIISALLWLWLCKLIAFTWSSTDNLNELIAKPGAFGVGGGGYLYALLALICANAVLLTLIRIRWLPVVLAVGATFAAIPLGWWLLNQGLESHVIKYGQTFSGAQFLLGPDRKNLLNEQVLFMRWSAVQCAGVLVIAVGARFVAPLIEWHNSRKRR